MQWNKLYHYPPSSRSTTDGSFSVLASQLATFTKYLPISPNRIRKVHCSYSRPSPPQITRPTNPKSMKTN